MPMIHETDVYGIPTTPFEHAVAQVAEKARAALGMSASERIDKAVRLVLSGAVHMQTDGTDSNPGGHG